MSNRNKVVNKYFIILVIGFIAWIAETAYFGFNKTPQSGAEGLADVATAGLIIYGLIGDLMRNVRITKTYHNVTSNNIHTKSVEVTGENQRVVYKTSYKVSPEAIDRLKGSNTLSHDSGSTKSDI